MWWHPPLSIEQGSYSVATEKWKMRIENKEDVTKDNGITEAESSVIQTINDSKIQIPISTFSIIFPMFSIIVVERVNKLHPDLLISINYRTQAIQHSLNYLRIVFRLHGNQVCRCICGSAWWGNNWHLCGNHVYHSCILNLWMKIQEK